MPHIKHCVPIIALAAALQTTPAAAQNLVGNGQLNASLVGWKVAYLTQGTASFDATRDADGSLRSGSAALASTNAPAGGSARLFGCIPATAGQKFFWGGKIRFREGEAATGSAYVVLSFRDGPDCTGTMQVGYDATHRSTSAGRGIWLDSSRDPEPVSVVAPAGTQSADLMVILTKSSAGGVLTINVDQLFVATVGSPLCDGKVPDLIGTDGGERLRGGGGTDVIAGLGGKDTLIGGGGFDTLCGGSGDDRLKGGSGDDVLIGGPGDDRLIGGGGVDVLVGGGGTDDCAGGAGWGDTATSCETTTTVP